ncbi:MAG TPA: radical SAM protein [Bacteroidales bacterium]|nr:radical SAM protein [Bacteroidales bacterium]
MNIRRNIRNYLKGIRSGQENFPVCVAPSTAMHFSFNGKVYPCHNNNNLAYGDLSKDSIIDIWGSINRNKMERNVKRLNLKKVGCLQCLHDINHYSYNSVSALRYEPYKKYLNNEYPSVLGFRFSDKCNIQCRMCFSNQNMRKDVNNKKFVYDDIFFQQLKLFVPHVKYAYFLGGEPFFEPANYKVLSLFKALNPNCKISIQTNGTIFTPEIKNLLNNGKYDINVSIDSLNSDLFSSIRKGAKLENVLTNIKEFINICRKQKTEFSSCYTPMIDNCLELPSIIDYFSKELKGRIWINKYYFPSKYALWTLSPKKIDEIYKKLSVYNPEINDEISYYNALQFKDFLKLLIEYKIESEERVCAKIDFKEEIVKQIKLIKKVIRTFKGDNYNELLDKLEIFREAPDKKSFYFLKKLLEVFSGDKLVEIISIMDKSLILNDIEFIEC